MVAAAAVLVVSAPVTAPGIACGPVPSGAAVVTLGHLADDGELTSLRQRTVGTEGESCEEEVEDPSLDVEVSILHRDVTGGSLEASELHDHDQVSTRVSVRDTTAEDRDLTVTGPVGTVAETRRIGVPQLVRATLRYPTTWTVTAPQGDGVSSHLDGDVVEVARTAVLFAPLLDDELVLEVTAVPGRGTPSVTVEATPLSAGDADAVPDGLLDRDTTAVVAALVDLAEDGARELVGGAEQLADGSEELADGTDDLADGAAEVADGAAGLGDGMAGLADGVAGLSSGVDGSAAGARELSGGADELATGTREVADGAAPLAQGAGELATGARMLADQLAVLGEVEPPEVDPEELVTAVVEIRDGVRQVRDDLAGLLPPDPDPTDPIVIAVAVLTELADGLDGLAQAIGEALATLAEAAEGLQAIADGADELATGAEGIADGIAELAGALQGLADGADALATGTGELAAGLTQLSGASDDLSDGADELTVGARGLAEGTDGLAGGTRELAEGADGLAAGMDELAEGAGELPGALAEAMGVADRGGERAAVTAAVLDEGAARAEARRGDAASVTTQLVHHGRDPLPLLPLGIAALGLALVVGTTTWLLRRRGART